MFKKVSAILLSLVFVIACFPIFSVSAASTAALYNVYGRYMLFAQNKDAIFSGTATTGSRITVELYNSSDKLIKEASARASDGVFEVSFKAPTGSFEEYTVNLYVDGQRFARLRNVVFGELWLASGQSNMSFPLNHEIDGVEMQESGKTLSKWLRVFEIPSRPTYNGSSSELPLDPQNEIAGAEWITGESSDVYSMSAVAYFFADSLINEINMPVGILNSSLTGSYICSWLSRDAIDNSDIASLYKSKGTYVSEESWDKVTHSHQSTMTANYNLKIAPLKNFRPSGMLWYQGESEISFGYTSDEYSKQLTLLQKSYSKLFGYNNQLMTLICSQLASYLYSKTGFDLLDWNIGLVNFREQNAKTRAVVSNYDVPLTYSSEYGFIHPLTKSDIGIRMASCAKGLVYNSDVPTSVANVENCKIKGSDVYISFDENIGDGLDFKGDKINGFAICSGDGNYVSADAEIVDEKTVRVYSSSVRTPVSVTYAYYLNNTDANLYSTYNGEYLMPVSPFVLRVIKDAHYWKNNEWMSCDETTALHNYNNSAVMHSNTWESDTDLFQTASAAYSGSKGLLIATMQNEFSISPVMSYENKGEDVPFKEIDLDYSDYGTFSFRIRNNLTTDVTISSVDFYTKGTVSPIFYSAMNIATESDSVTIPGDGKWHEVVYDLNTLYRKGLKYSVFTNEKLNEITGIRINFSAEGSSFINVDEFSIGAEDGSNLNMDNVLADNFPIENIIPDVEDLIFPEENSPIKIDYTKNLIYGFDIGFLNNIFLNYVNVSEYVNISFSKNNIATGTVVTLRDKMKNTVVTEFAIVLFGDYNGDGTVDTEDCLYFAAVSNFEIFDYYDHEYLFMAADINGDGMVDNMDEEIVNSASNFEVYIDQSADADSRVVYY